MKRRKGLISLAVAVALVGGIGIANAANTASVTVGVDNNTAAVTEVTVSQGDLKVQNDRLTLDNITIATSGATVPTYQGTVQLKVSDPNKFVFAAPAGTEYIVCDNGTQANIVSQANTISADNSSMYFTLLDNSSLTIGAGEKCYVAPNNATSSLSEANLPIIVKKGTSGSGTIEYSLIGSDGVTTLESGNSQSFFTVGPVLKAKITRKFSQLIDAQNPAVFKDGSDNDTLEVEVTPVSNYIFQTYANDNLTFTIKGDTPIAKVLNAADDNLACKGSNDNKTITCETTTGSYEGSIQFNLQADNSTGSIAPTQSFTLDASLNAVNGSSVGQVSLLSGTAAGSWLFSGYTALVPKVATGFGWHTYIELEFTGSVFPTTLRIGIPGTTCSYEKSISIKNAQRVMISSDDIYTQLENQGCDLSAYEVDTKNGIYQFPVTINMPKAQGVTGFASVYSPSGQVMRVPIYGGLNTPTYGLDASSK